MDMRWFCSFFASAALFFALVSPASALGLSFGGHISLIIPCSGGLWVQIISARTGDLGTPEHYIWTPATITYLAGPPSFIGQGILGVADAPFVCFTADGNPLFGERMQIVGTAGSGAAQAAVEAAAAAADSAAASAVNVGGTAGTSAAGAGLEGAAGAAGGGGSFGGAGATGSFGDSSAGDTGGTDTGSTASTPPVDSSPSPAPAPSPQPAGCVDIDCGGMLSTTPGTSTIDPQGLSPTLSPTQLQGQFEGTQPYAAQLGGICAAQGFGDCSTAQAVMAVESGGQPNLCSAAGACGLMQITADTARTLDPTGTAGLTDAQIQQQLVDDPTYKMNLGVQYLAQLEGNYGQSADAIAAYNGGPGANTPSSTCPGQTYWACSANLGYAQTRAYVPNVIATRNLITQ